MKLSNLILAKQIFNYILENSNCIIPDIKNQLSIQTSKPPKTPEMRLYRIIQSMVKEKYITKNKISNIYPGGPQFRLKTTKKGISEFSKIDKTGGKKELKNLNDFENGLIEFSDEAQFILQELIDDIFDSFQPKTKIDAQEVKSKIINTISSLTSKLSKILS